MDETVLRNLDFEIDLEKGALVNEEDLNKTPVSSTKRPEKLLISKVYDEFVDVPAKGEERILSLCGNDKRLGDFYTEINVNVVTVKTPERGVADEKRKKTSNKKSPKPPRPPTGPSLDAADMKLIKEISELTMIKRARIDRVKALKKMRAAKTSSSSSSNSNVFALVLTVLFFLVVAFQGMSCTRSSPAIVQGSPTSARAEEGGLISVQYNLNPSASITNGPGSGSPNLPQQVAGSDAVQKR